MAIGSFWICYKFHNIKYGPTHLVLPSSSFPGLDTSSKARWFDPLQKLNSYLCSKRNSKGETTSNNTSCNHFIESFLVLKIPQRPTTIKTLACPTTFHTRKIISVMYFSTISQQYTILRYIFSPVYYTLYFLWHWQGH